MRKIILAAGMSQHVPYDENCDYIGIDRGAFILMKQKIRMLVAIGDFDSINDCEFEQLKQYTHVEKLPAHKNETDSEYAIQYAMNLGYKDIVLYGGLGGRIDHELANLHLMIHRRLPITLMDEQNLMSVIEKGTYKIEKKHTYLSFLALEESCISERNVAYPLNKQVLTPSDIYAVSNEIHGTYAEIEVHYGRFLMIQSDDAKHTVKT